METHGEDSGFPAAASGFAFRGEPVAKWLPGLDSNQG